ncbi:hypothetical protein N9937_02105 [bacterium]|nr:hypothetical protein [bacterium]
MAGGFQPQPFTNWTFGQAFGNAFVGAMQRREQRRIEEEEKQEKKKLRGEELQRAIDSRELTSKNPAIRELAIKRLYPNKASEVLAADTEQQEDEEFDRELSIAASLGRISPEVSKKYFKGVMANKADKYGVDLKAIEDDGQKTNAYNMAVNNLIQMVRDPSVPPSQKKLNLGTGLAEIANAFPKRSSTRSGLSMVSSLKGAIPETLERAGIENNARARAMFNGTKFLDLKPDQQLQVLNENEESRARVRKATTEAGIEAVLEKQPLTSSDLTRFINPETLEKFPAGTTMKDAKVAGAISASPAQIAALSELDSATSIVETVGNLSAKLMTAEGVAAAGAQKLMLEAGALTGANDDAATYEATKAQFTGVLSRTLGGERGVLTDMDIKRVVKGMPAFGDTKIIRDKKMAIINNLLQVAIRAKRRVVLGGASKVDEKQAVKVLLDDLDNPSNKKETKEARSRVRWRRK